MSTESVDEFFLSRQPIIAGERRLVGWELAITSAAGRELTDSEESGEDGELGLIVMRRTRTAPRWPASHFRRRLRTFAAQSFPVGSLPV
ncbi:MAG: hypothetical protein CL933_23185 [Deltaproteobacteria bacterium]|nr:hypothetical protein [Deltaproteobacteria bacterium]